VPSAKKKDKINGLKPSAHLLLYKEAAVLKSSVDINMSIFIEKKK